MPDEYISREAALKDFESCNTVFSSATSAIWRLHRTIFAATRRQNERVAV